MQQVPISGRIQALYLIQKYVLLKKCITINNLNILLNIHVVYVICSVLICFDLFVILQVISAALCSYPLCMSVCVPSLCV